jgi:hypothetical protein
MGNFHYFYFPGRRVDYQLFLSKYLDSFGGQMDKKRERELLSELGYDVPESVPVAASALVSESQPQTDEALQSEQTSELTGAPVTPVEPIVIYIRDYRKLKVELDAIEIQLGKLKPLIQQEVEARGTKYQDELGYARMVVRDASVSYPGQAVDGLAEQWCKSEDPIMRSCGQMIYSMRKPTLASSYLQVK